MTDMPEKTLKPCPFCGGEARRFTFADDGLGNNGGDVIECSRCKASSHVEFGFKENLESVWNTRSGIEWNEALEAAIREADEKENYWNTVAYDKRQAGQDDNFACASASAYAHMGQTLRAMKRGLKP